MKFFFHYQTSEILGLICAAVFLFGAIGCQNKIESDAKLLAADQSAAAEIKRINQNLAASQPISRNDIDQLNELREKYPAAPDLNRTLQAALIRRGDWAAVEKLLADTPENEKTNLDRINHAKVYLKLGQYENAADLLKTSTADKTIEFEAKTLLGQAQFYLGQNIEAAQTFDSVWDQITAQRKSDEIILRGMIYFRQGNHEQAIATLKKALEFAPENIPANNALSRVYAARGDTANAEIYLAKAQNQHEQIAADEKRKSRLVPLYYRLEDAYRAKRHEEVVSLARQILPNADDKNKAALYQYLAAAFQAQGKQAEAADALAEAARFKEK